MHCLPLGLTKGGNVKIVVFGSRDWARSSSSKRIRYVSRYRLRSKVDDKLISLEEIENGC